MKKKPQDGGCWFCDEDDENEALYFSVEFDTYVHKNCCLKYLHLGDPEAEIIFSELFA